MVREYTAYVSCRALRQLTASKDPTLAIVFAYLRALTTDTAYPATAERIARISDRPLKGVRKRVDALRMLGMTTSDWLGYQVWDTSRKAYISVGTLNTLRSLGISDSLQRSLLAILTYVDREGWVIGSATQIATAVGLSPLRVFRSLKDLEKRGLIAENRVAHFMRKEKGTETA